MSMAAEQIHVTCSQFSRIETGKILPDAGEVIVIRLVLDVSYQWLLEGNAEL